MKIRRALFGALLLGLLSVVAGGLWLRAQQRQYALNRQLIEAVVNHDTQQAVVLISAGADPNTYFNPPPAPSFKLLLRQVLHHEPLPANDSPTAFLLACGVNFGLEQESAYGGPPIYPDTLPLVQAMFLHGANLHAQTPDNNTALYGAASANQMRVVAWLLEHHVDVNAPGLFGRTPLIEAVVHDHPNLVRLLLAHGADVRRQEQLGMTALHHAVLWDMDTDIIRQLLAQGADPNLPNKQGDTPLKIAQQKKRLDIVSLLRKGGK